MTSTSQDPAVVRGHDGWLLYHSVGRYPGQAEDAGAILAQAAQDWYANGDRHWFPGLGQRARAVELFSALIGAPPGSVFTVENVTLAFASFVTALPPGQLSGKRVLIAGDCFPSIHFLLAGLAPQLGFELVTVPLQPGAHFVSDDAFIDAWDDRVALSIITWITSTSSKRADVERLVSHGRKMGSLVAADITQGAGLLPFDASKVDFAATTSLKWLCGMTGAGFGYVSPKLMERLEPSLRGWFSQLPPLNWDLDKFAYAGDARKFGNGTPSLLPYIGSLPGIEWVHNRPAGELVERNERLCERLIGIADASGLDIVSPRNAAQRGGSVMVALADESSAEALRERLASEGIYCDRRAVRVRWSPGPLTTEAALDHMAHILPRIAAEVSPQLVGGAR